MQTVTRELLISRGKVSLASWPAIGSVAVLLGASLLSQPATAQVSSQTLPKRPPLAPEVLAMHAKLKRAVPSVPGYLESASAVSSPANFNSD